MKRTASSADHDDEASPRALKRGKEDAGGARVVGGRAANNDQFFTKRAVAAKCLARVREVVGALEDFACVLEPSAGTGAFFDALPRGKRVGVDIDAAPGSECVKKDFLKIKAAPAKKRPPDHFVVTDKLGRTVRIPCESKNVLVVGNPPFGKNAATAIEFVNHALELADTVCFVLPRTFNKASAQGRVDRRAHLVFSEDVEDGAFEFNGQDYNVPCTFQIWKVRENQPRRELFQAVRTHPDFTFVSDCSKRGVFAVQRVGVNAGTVKKGAAMKKASPNSHYFILPKDQSDRVFKRMQSAEMASSSVKHQTAGCPSISKDELISMYSAQRRSGSGSTAAQSQCKCPACKQKQG